MNILQTYFVRMILISFLIVITLTSVVVDINKPCGCESLELEQECKMLEQCSYQNSKCVTLACNMMANSTGCYKNSLCAWYNNSCTDFVSCTYYNISNSQDCWFLYHGCDFDSRNNICLDPNPEQQSPCYLLSKDSCQKGKEGFCAYENYQCQEMTKCSQINSHCEFYYPACHSPADMQDNCTSAMTCKEAQPNNCRYAKKNINGNQYYLCDNSDCSDFKPQIQTKETCFINSLGYYHWVKDTCSNCAPITTVDITSQCICEEMTSEIECSSLSNCMFNNNQCTPFKQCSEITTEYNCKQNQKCIWEKDVCNEFTSCGQYMIYTPKECIDLHNDCTYDQIVNKCIKINFMCYQYSMFNCYKGTDGFCQWDGRFCQVLMKCEEAQGPESCNSLGNKCKWVDKYQYCQSASKECQQITEGSCMLAYKSLRDNQADICILGENKKCQNFNPEQTNKETCAIQSYGYYTWKNEKCQKCNGSTHNKGRLFLFIILIVQLLI